MIIPSIDLSQGKAVQLKQGKEKVLERDNPLDLVRDFSRFGDLAVIDLDAAMGTGSNTPFIQKICQTADCRVGGGIRSVEDAADRINWGARKVIIGTKAFDGPKVNTAFLHNLRSTLGREKIIVAVDSVGGKIVTNGWRTATGLDVFQAIQQVEPYVSEFLFTCVEKEGLMQGTDMKLLRLLRKATTLPLTAAGGITSSKEIQELSSLGFDVQLGMAIYTGKLSVPEAFLASLKWTSSLIPTITADPSSQVLMLAYSSRESLKKTFETSRVWYYSRSRKRLWQKGETSGNYQEFRKIRSDCDGDALLITADQQGVACHKGRYSCFGERKFTLEQLQKVLRKRIKEKPEHSYTASLTDKVLAEKIREEAIELAGAESLNETVWEAADLLYFIMVLLAKRGIPVRDVMKELERRRNTRRPTKVSK